MCACVCACMLLMQVVLVVGYSVMPLGLNGVQCSEVLVLVTSVTVKQHF